MDQPNKDQLNLNRNIVHSLSILNKAIMNLQESFISITRTDPHFNHLSDLTKMDLQLLHELQHNLERLKELVG